MVNNISSYWLLAINSIRQHRAVSGGCYEWRRHIHIIIRLVNQATTHKIVSIISIITTVSSSLLSSSLLGGYSWTQTSAPFLIWQWITSDSTGQKLAAVQYQDSSYNPGGIYTSSSGYPLNYYFKVNVVFHKIIAISLDHYYR